MSSLRLPILVMIQPVNGKEHISPVGMANNTPPNAASDKCNVCCIPGIRDAQLAKQSPDIKNIAPTAMRNAKRDLTTGRKAVVSICFCFYWCKTYTKCAWYKDIKVRLKYDFILAGLLMVTKKYESGFSDLPAVAIRSATFAFYHG